ncbi:MAG: hypothetical protein HQK53_01855, partial [Oligoflexia bacterium]|nr:hypothetical protein [Oligoflexia bacterium]
MFITTKKTVNKFINVTIPTVLIFTITIAKSVNVQASIPIEEIKDLAAPLSIKHQELSPLHGIVWAEGKIVDNLTEFSTEESEPIKSLSEELFYRADAHTFAPTNLSYNAATYLHPHLLGEIVGTLEATKWLNQERVKYKIWEGEFNKFMDTTVKNKLTGMIAMDRQVNIVFEQYLKDTWFKIQQVKDLLAIKSSRLLSSEQEELLYALFKDLHTLSPIPFNEATFEKFAAVYISENGEIPKRLRKHYNENFKKNINRVVGSLIKNRNNSKFLPLISAFLWFKIKKKEDILNYYRGIKEGLQEEEIKIRQLSVGNAYHEYFNEDYDYLDSNGTLSQEWVKSRYEENERSEQPAFGHSDGVERTVERAVGTELKVFRLIKKSTLAAPLLPYHIGHIGQQAELSFADCGETTVRNIIKMALSNDDGTFNLNVINRMITEVQRLLLVLSPEELQTMLPATLPKTLPTMSQLVAIKNFFAKYNTESSQNLDEARNEWAEITSNIPGIAYSRNYANNHYEMNTGAKSMLQIISGLIGLPSITTWKQFFDFLSLTSGRDFEITEEHFDAGNPLGLGSIIFSTSHQGSFRLVFTDGHFYLDSVEKEPSIAEEEHNLSEIQQSLLRSGQSHMSIPMQDLDIDSISLYPSTPQKLQTLINHL